MTETDSKDEDRRVGFDSLEAVEEGDRIAVRAVDDTVTVLIGTVTSRLFDDPGEEDPLLRPDSEADSSYSTTFLAIDYSSVYEIVDGERIDLTAELNSRPQYRLFAGGQLRDPALPAVQYSADDQFELIIPEVMMSKGRPDGYYPHSVGRIVDVVFGETIWPEEIIPDGDSSV